MNDIKIESILKPLRSDQTVLEDDFFRLVVEKLESNHTGCVCVVDREHRPLGVLTDGDIRRFVYRAGGETLASFFSHTAGRMAKRSMLTGRPQMTVTEALAVMHDRRIGALPIVNETGQLVGIVNLQDLIGGCIQRYEQT